MLQIVSRHCVKSTQKTISFCRKLNAQSLHCDFLSARKTYLSLMELLEQLTSKNLVADTPLVGVYCTVSMYYFVQSNYDEVSGKVQKLQG